MTPRPHVVCLMLSSIDGRLHASKWTTSPDGDHKRWSALYEAYQDTLDCDGWLVGRTTMAEMSKATAHPVAQGAAPSRPVHRAVPDAARVAVAVDTAGALHFDGPTIQGNHVIVALGAGVADEHLRELAADGVSYVVAAGDAVDPATLLDALSRDFGVRRLALEGGATINGSFFAAGLVDELQVIVAPGLDGRVGAQGIVEHGEAGLPGSVALSFVDATPMDAGCVRLRYAVRRGAG